MTSQNKVDELRSIIKYVRLNIYRKRRILYFSYFNSVTISLPLCIRKNAYIITHATFPETNSKSLLPYHRLNFLDYMKTENNWRRISVQFSLEIILLILWFVYVHTYSGDEWHHSCRFVRHMEALISSTSIQINPHSHWIVLAYETFRRVEFQERLSDELEDDFPPRGGEENHVLSFYNCSYLSYATRNNLVITPRNKLYRNSTSSTNNTFPNFRKIFHITCLRTASCKYNRGAGKKTTFICICE